MMPIMPDLSPIGIDGSIGSINRSETEIINSSWPDIFFFNGGRWGEKEFYMDSMYSVLKSLVPQNEWPSYVTSLIAETQKKKAFPRLLYIYTQEKMWSEYMDYIRKDPSIYEIDEAPNEVKKLFREEIIKLYAADVRNYFQRASSRDSYRNGVAYIRKLIRYGGSRRRSRL